MIVTLFQQLHLHWGTEPMNGSEHLVGGVGMFPAHIHPCIIIFQAMPANCTLFTIMRDVQISTKQ
jgi:hypothetical protein